MEGGRAGVDKEKKRKKKKKEEISLRYTDLTDLVQRDSRRQIRDKSKSLFS